MKNTDIIPFDSTEIEHVLHLLRVDLKPENRKLVLEGQMRGYNVAPRLRAALNEVIAPHVPSYDRSDWSDFANLTANDRYDEWIRAAAVAVCNLHYLESASDRRAVDGIDPEDDPLDYFPEWARLRGALLEVALWLTQTEMVTQETRAKRAEAHAEALGEAAEQVRVFRGGRKKGALAPHNEYLRGLILDHPGLTTKELARLVRLRHDDKDCPFDRDDDDDVLRASGEAINLETMIENVRKRHVNRSDTAI